MEHPELPNTDSPQVMEQAIAMHLTHTIWEHFSRTIHADEMETQLLELYDRVYAGVTKAHSAHG